MKIWASHYTLKSRDWLSAKAQSQERVGALLRIEDSTGAVGYADLHPWTELGDLSLDAQLKILADGGQTPLSHRSIALAGMDRKSRSEGVSAFQDLVIPESHCLVSQFENLSESRIEELAGLGFQTIKFKLGASWPKFVAYALSQRECLKSFQLRLDFNGSLSPEGFREFAEELNPQTRAQVEFVEDPVPWSKRDWLSFSGLLPLALDRMEFGQATKSEAVMEDFSFLKWLVLKPAVQDPDFIWALAEKIGSRVAVTSYLDHPVGQMGAALCAAQLAHRDLLAKQNSPRIGTCGLVSQMAFENNQFSEALRGRGPKLIPAEGSGIGFDSLLEKQKWIKIR